MILLSISFHIFKANDNLLLSEIFYHFKIKIISMNIMSLFIIFRLIEEECKLNYTFVYNVYHLLYSTLYVTCNLKLE